MMSAMDVWEHKNEGVFPDPPPPLKATHMAQQRDIHIYMYVHPGPTLADVAGTRTVTDDRDLVLSSSIVYLVAIRRFIFSSWLCGNNIRSDDSRCMSAAAADDIFSISFGSFIRTDVRGGRSYGYGLVVVVLFIFFFSLFDSIIFMARTANPAPAAAAPRAVATSLPLS